MKLKNNINKNVFCCCSRHPQYVSNIPQNASSNLQHISIVIRSKNRVIWSFTSVLFSIQDILIIFIYINIFIKDPFSRYTMCSKI